MSTESKLQDVLDSGQTVNIMLTSTKPHQADADATGVQTVTGRIVSTNTPDVVQVQPLDGTPVSVPISRILVIEERGERS